MRGADSGQCAPNTPPKPSGSRRAGRAGPRHAGLRRAGQGPAAPSRATPGGAAPSRAGRATPGCAEPGGPRRAGRGGQGPSWPAARLPALLVVLVASRDEPASPRRAAGPASDRGGASRRGPTPTSRPVPATTGSFCTQPQPSDDWQDDRMPGNPPPIHPDAPSVDRQRQHGRGGDGCRFPYRGPPDSRRVSPTADRRSDAVAQARHGCFSVVGGPAPAADRAPPSARPRTRRPAPDARTPRLRSTAG